MLSERACEIRIGDKIWDDMKDGTRKSHWSSLPEQARQALALVEEAKRRAAARRRPLLAGSMGNQHLIEQLKSLPPHTFKEVRRKKK